MNQELQEYIKKAKEAGRSDEEIKRDLSGAGWKEEDVHATFSQLSGSNYKFQEPEIANIRNYLSSYVSEPSFWWGFAGIVLVSILGLIFLGYKAWSDILVNTLLIGTLILLYPPVYIFSQINFFVGRIGRGNYFRVILLLSILQVLTATAVKYIDAVYFVSPLVVFASLATINISFLIIYLLVSSDITARRLHDTGFPAAWLVPIILLRVLSILIPLLRLITFIIEPILIFKKGEEVPNKWGDLPKGDIGLTEDFLNLRRGRGSKLMSMFLVFAFFLIPITIFISSFKIHETQLEKKFSENSTVTPIKQVEYNCVNEKYAYRFAHPSDWKVWKVGFGEAELASCSENLASFIFAKDIFGEPFKNQINLTVFTRDNQPEEFWRGINSLDDYARRASAPFQEYSLPPQLVGERFLWFILDDSFSPEAYRLIGYHNDSIYEFNIFSVNPHDWETIITSFEFLDKLPPLDVKVVNGGFDITWQESSFPTEMTSRLYSPNKRYLAYTPVIRGGVEECGYLGGSIGEVRIFDTTKNKEAVVTKDLNFGFPISGWSSDSQWLMIGIGPWTTIGAEPNKCFSHYINFLLYNVSTGELIKKDRDGNTFAKDLREICSTLFKNAEDVYLCDYTDTILNILKKESAAQ